MRDVVAIVVLLAIVLFGVVTILVAVDHYFPNHTPSGMTCLLVADRACGDKYEYDELNDCAGPVWDKCMGVD